MNLFDDGEVKTPKVPKVEGALPFNVWLVQQQRSRDQREDYGSSDQYHSQKMPPELARRMLAHAKPAADWLVIDPFNGSGTTGVEWHQMGGKRYEGWEIEPEYAELARATLTHCGSPGIVHLGDCRATGLEDESVDLVVTSPPYAKSDPNRDSSDRIHEIRGIHLEGTSHGKIIPYSNQSLAACKCVGDHTQPGYEMAMFDVFEEMRRVLKPGRHVLLAIREVWSDRGMEDLPGLCADLARKARLMLVDKVYAIEAGMDEFGRLSSRSSLHRHRLARLMADRECGRGVPAVTTVLVLQRRARPAAA